MHHKFYAAVTVVVYSSIVQKQFFEADTNNF